ncbi:uncharacterized protein B0T23DRAFT_404044 [Neurospora hispaniola]|uniref:Uncharacterized protein n=1 Tax=Neurospora hispaniola TaxID=588809 RepID=A0AAJ0IB52_9PEZI|nr:hypothetical protein B0T23DRAFT_404044 [Neurospora hispaniola]
MASDCRFVYPNGSKVSTLPSSPPHPNLGSSESWRERQHQPSLVHKVFVIILTHHGERRACTLAPPCLLPLPAEDVTTIAASNGHDPSQSIGCHRNREPVHGQRRHPRPYIAK